MPDFHTSIASLKVVLRTLDAAVAAGRVPAGATPRLRAAFAAAPDMPELGALLDAILYHCGPTDQELMLLTDAANLWRQYRPLMTRLSQARAQFESLVINPNQPDVGTQTQALATDLRRLGAQIEAWGKAAVLFLNRLQPLTYLPEVGQARDAPVSQWSWLDLAIGRRTGALRVTLLDKAVASNDARAIAFAYGAIAGYAGRLCASGYRNGVVGGPRRSHLYRHRLAARTLGAWLRQNYPADTLSLTDLGQRVARLLGNPPALPPALRTTLADALGAAYQGVAPTPNLDQAAAKMVQHLELLGLFTMSDPGALPPVPFPVPMAGTIQTTIQARGLRAAGGPPWPVPAVTPPRPITRPRPGAPFWKTLVASIITVILGLVGALLGLLIGGAAGAAIGAGVGVAGGVAVGSLMDAWELDIGTVSVGDRVSSLQSDDALLACAYLELLHEQLYTAGDQFLLALKGSGLVYPESRDLSGALFAQFLRMPRQDPVFRRPSPDPDRFTVYPETDLERPSLSVFPYGPSSPPSIFLDPPGGGVDPTVAGLGLQLWLEEEAGGAGTQLRQTNRQLDADLGPTDVCWRGRVTVDPIQVIRLAYSDL